MISTGHQSDFVMNLTQRALSLESITSGSCFLCGGPPTQGKGEHIFPRWLQKRFDLWDQKLTLLNGTRIPYRDIRVPACEDCNGRVLGRTENYVSRLRSSAISDWSHSHSFEVGRWLSKILIGILIKEASLLCDRSSPQLGMIFPPQAIGELVLMHLLVQSWRKVIRFQSLHAAHPFTLYVYEIEKDEYFSDFNLSTNLFGKSLCIRFGDLGFAFVADGGLQHEMSELGPYDLGFQKLHPVQFDELAARVHYKSALRDATHLYVHYESPENFNFNQVEVMPYSSKKLDDGSDRIFRDWSLAELALALENYRVPSRKHLIDHNGEATYTFLVGTNGRKLNFPTGSFSKSSDQADAQE
jgi:hypothetical protein